MFVTLFSQIIHTPTLSFIDNNDSHSNLFVIDTIDEPIAKITQFNFVMIFEAAEFSRRNFRVFQALSEFFLEFFSY